MPEERSQAAPLFFEGQIIHVSLLIPLLVLAILLVDFEGLSERQLFGVGADCWFLISLLIPVAHQIYVWLSWRGQLCYGTITNWFGSRAFAIYKAVFFILFLSRPISLILLTIADHDSFKMAVPWRIVICVILGLPAIYTLYSVARYFGTNRAAGIDHFDETYRDKTLVKKGIFQFASNSMYWFGFLTLWVIAIAGASWSALVITWFSHLYIWVHYYCTERPDMKAIYGSSSVVVESQAG